MHLPPWYVLAPLASALALAFALVALALSVCWVRFWRRRLRLPEGFDEVTETRTPDGATIVLGRIRPVGDPSKLPPVLLCHGLAMNRHALALDPHRSLARVLAARGRDCWLLELRGASPGRHGREVRGGSFDTYLSNDVPTALAYVRAVTDAPEVDWVGYSMGGMLAYAHLGAMRGAGVRRLVTVASPVRLKSQFGTRVMGAAPYVLTPFGVALTTPLGWLAAGAAPLLWPGLPQVITRGFRGHHYDRAALRSIFVAGFSDVPAGVMKQFARWVRTESFTSEDGLRDYREGLALLTVPSLIIAGDEDRIAVPAWVREAYDGIGAAEKRFVEVGPASGAHAHYDHLDLVMGAKAPEEVFSYVVEWLERG